VLCDGAPLADVLRAIARKSGLALEGLSAVPPGATATVELQRRPLAQALDFVLGGHGLAHAIERGTLVIAPAPTDESALLARAESAWRIVAAEGDPRAAGRAQLAQGNLAEVRGDLERAYRAYAALAESEHGADAAEATFRAGLVLERLGHRAEAAQHFRVLSGREGAEAWHARARLELARVSIDLGDAQGALHLLNFLDANYPADGASAPSERAERRLVRAQAHVALEAWIPALRALEEAPIDAARESGPRTLRIRATALEGLGFESEAGRAWLLCARDAALAEDREHAFRRAAELALAAGDELATLFVCREAAKAGSGDALASAEATARARLGLDEQHVPATLSERLALAESLLAGTAPAGTERDANAY
jgi:tetratricopeptide (TPR) repeat protein